jgi:hypothetical protein
VVALKKGLQPIQFTGDFKLLAGDSTIMMQAPVASLDTIAKTDSVKIVPVAPSPNSVKAVPAKIEKPNAPKAIAKKKVQVKGSKSKPKLNNKPKNNSLNKKNKTAKAIMPKKLKSPTKNN